MLGESWTFEIPGPPVAKERPRRNNKTGTWYTPTKTQDAERHVAQCAMAAGLKLEPGVKYGVELYFYCSAHPRDLDNMVKLVLDGLGQYGKPDGWNDRQVEQMYQLVVSVKSAAEEKTIVRIGKRRRVP